MAGGLTLEPRFFFRRHEDRFVLIRSNPDIYTNDHVTRRFGGELRGLAELGEDHSLAVGVEGVYEDIASTGVRSGASGPALGDHLRRRASASAEVDGHDGPVRWQGGGRVDLRSFLGPRVSGTAAATVTLAGPWSARASVGTVHRVPTFTDLYYADPANLGNPDLQPEHGWAWDAGLAFDHGPWRGSATWFERHERDLIDWARADGDSLWHVLNVADGRARGVETSVGWRGSRGHRLVVGWTWLERSTSLDTGYDAKYGLLVPRQHLTAQGTVVLPAGLEATAALRYLERSGGPDAFRVSAVLDGRLSWRGPRGWFAGLTVTNLADRRVMEVPGIVLPGRLATVSAGRRF